MPYSTAFQTLPSSVDIAKINLELNQESIGPIEKQEEGIKSEMTGTGLTKIKNFTRNNLHFEHFIK